MGVKHMVSPIVAAILSFIIPGLGQLLLDDSQKGLKFIVIWIILAILAFFTAGILGILSLAFSIYAAYDAYKLAQ